MSGFTGIILFKDSPSIKLNEIKFPDLGNRFYPKLESIHGDSYSLCLYGNRRLYNRPLIHSSASYIYGMEGVHLNYPEETFQKKNQIKSEGFQPTNDFLTALKKTHGTFSGFNFDKLNKELFLFTDQTASRQIFYYSGNGVFAFSSSIFILCDILQQFSIKLSLNEPASYMMLSLGYLLNDFTLVSEIKKLVAGNYIIANENELSIHQYHNFYEKVKYTKITKDLIEELDSRFKSSVIAEYQYDRSLGMRHLVTLSGGLDSRMNLMTAWESGFTDITALTFSEGMASDELIARQISNNLKIEHIILPLNNGLVLFDIVTPLMLNNCSVFYFGAAHTLSAVCKLNFSNFGLCHNGSISGSSKGAYLSGPESRIPHLHREYAISDKLFSRFQSLFDNTIAGLYPDEEMFLHYNRGFNATHNGAWMTRPFAESLNTFLEPHFAELAYSISPNLRYNSVLTIDWLNKLRKNIASYKWASTGFLPTNNQGKRFVQKVICKFNRAFIGDNTDTNPFNRWYASNEHLRIFIKENFDNSNAWNIIPLEIRTDIKMLFKTGTILEKLLCISYLKSLELLFLDSKL